MEGRTRSTFREKYKRLCSSYRTKYDEDSCREYYEVLKDYGEATIDEAFKIAKKEIKFFPSIAELIEIIGKMPPKWFYHDIKSEQTTIEEQHELEELLKELGGDEEEKYE